jgi:hypothetical protein
MTRKVTAVLLCLITTSLLASNDAAIRRMRDRAKEAIEDGEATPEHIKPMIDMLRKSTDNDDQRQLLDIIVDLGRHDGSSPAAIKKYINEQMTPILLAIAGNRKNSTFLRGDAIHGLRNMGASRAALEEVTKMALADADGYVQSRGEILENYLKSLPAEPAAESIKPVDAAKEKEALKFLKSRKLGASPDQLHRSAMEGKADEVRALLAAGVPVDADNGAALIGAMSACSSEGETAELVEVVGVLVEAGADLKRLDDNKNTPLITAAQYCGDKVVSKLVAGGANVNVTNGSGMTPLMIAIFSNRYEAAEALVAKGAKLTKDQAAMVSAMPDPRAKALAQKASKAKAK